MDDPVYRQAVEALQQVLAEADRHPHSGAPVMALATVDPLGQPSVRYMFLQALDESGLLFFTHVHSRKTEHLAHNPRAGACLYWPELGRQIQVQGTVQHVPDAEANAHWVTRGRDSQLAAWASRQSEPLESQEDLRERLAEHRERFDFQRQVPRPRHWVGYRLVPESIELWRADWHTLRERVCYRRGESGWSRTLLSP